MLVLIIMLVTTTKVNARSITSSNNAIIPLDIIETFDNSFKSPYFYYLSYDCNYGDSTRTCYFAYDTLGNFVDITYVGIGYSYNRIVNIGTDDNISIQGVKYTSTDFSTLILYFLSFVFMLILVCKLIGCF